MILGLCVPCPQAASPHHSGLGVPWQYWPCHASCQPSMGLVLFQLPWMLLDPCHSWCCFLGPLPPPWFSSLALPGALLSSGPISASWAQCLCRAARGLGHEGTFTCSPKGGCPPPDLYRVSGRQRPPVVLKLRFNSIRTSVLCLPVLRDGGCAPGTGLGARGMSEPDNTHD